MLCATALIPGFGRSPKVPSFFEAVALAHPFAGCLALVGKSNCLFLAIRSLIRFRLWRLHGPSARIDWLKSFAIELFEGKGILSVAGFDSEVVTLFDDLAVDLAVFIDREIARQRDEELKICRAFRDTVASRKSRLLAYRQQQLAEMQERAMERELLLRRESLSVFHDDLHANSSESASRFGLK